MEGLIRQATEHKLQLHQRLAVLQRMNEGPAIEQLESDTSIQLRELFALCTRLRNQLGNAPIDRREKLKPQVDNLHDEYQDLQQAYKAHLARRDQKAREQREHEELLAADIAPVDSTALFIDDAELDHHDSLLNSNRGVDSLLSQASGVLSELAEQRDVLKRIQRRMLDIGNQLGLSNTLMRLIEQRTQQDFYILIAGMIGSVVIMVLVYVYFA
eukprot:TRINITY_DN6159_c0_g1_i1.p1 TRINITY_DN6159_c0_g1~~TRINITY_DN6159_c0_g1_i1.p1  ORF type:complete len:214 (+),score=31.93 TRINITY_DN6159_c0_g1_i1:43-684(+)